MKCFYHKSDFDGKCSAAIIKYTYPECELYGVDYKDKLVGNPDWSHIVYNAGEVIWVVDICLDAEDMNFLNNGLCLHWIDHHKSSIDNAHKRGFLATGGQSLEIGDAACEQVWEYIHPEKKIPYAVHLLGRYDVWDHKNLEVLPFQYGLRSYDQEQQDPNDIDFWKGVFFIDSWMPAILRRGNIILDYQNTQNALIAKSMTYERNFHGYRALVICRSHSNSKIFDSVFDPEKHDIMILWACVGQEFKYSLFCNKSDIDVSKIAVKYGGGGHRGAAGFYTAEYIFGVQNDIQEED